MFIAHGPAGLDRGKGCVHGPSLELGQFLAQGNAEKRVPSMKDMASWLKNATTEKLTGFMRADPVKNLFYHCTAGPQDALVMPAGWLVAERIGTRHDYYGIKAPLIRKADLAELDAWSKYWVRQEKPHENIQMIIDALTLLD